MSVNNCDNGHKYGLWSLSDVTSMASRKCVDCGFVETLPKSGYIEEQIKMQNIAKKLLEDFLILDEKDANLIRDLNVMLDGAYYYIDNASKSLLNNKLNSFLLSNYISEENKFFIKTFILAIRDNDINLLCDTLEIFQKFNIDTLNNMLDVNVQKGYSK